MHAQNKDRPSPEWIAATRHRYTVEREIDRALTYKLERRGTPPYSKLPLETLVKGAQSLIEANLKQPFEITDAKWLSGGASKLQMAFNLTWNRPGVGNETTRMVLRNDVAELQRLAGWIEGFAQHGISSDVSFAVHLCLEEAVTERLNA